MLHITEKMTGKMLGMQSLNTDCFSNDFCIKQSQSKNDNVICKKCYAIRMLKRYKSAKKCFANNGRMLSTELLYATLPIINASFFRINAFGELHNNIHFINVLNLCEKNPNTMFTLWTKRPNIVNKVLKENWKPENLILIYSNPIIDTKAKLPENFDKVFNVFSPPAIKKQNVKINCGKRICVECKLCYTKNRTKIINELLK